MPQWGVWIKPKFRLCKAIGRWLIQRYDPGSYGHAPEWETVKWFFFKDEAVAYAVKLSLEENDVDMSVLNGG
jgi:hypothetical protein